MAAAISASRIQFQFRLPRRLFRRNSRREIFAGLLRMKFYRVIPDTEKICCSQTEILLPPEMKSGVFSVIPPPIPVEAVAAATSVGSFPFLPPTPALLTKLLFPP